MSTENHRDKFAIVGVGQSPTTRTHAQGKSAHLLEAWAARLALEDAGLTREDIDGALHAGPSDSGGDGYSRKLGIRPDFYTYILRGGASGVAAIQMATHVLATGKAKYVMISDGDVSWSLAHSTDERTRSHTHGVGNVNGLGYLGYNAAVGAASVHGWYASRHMHEYGTTHEHLGAAALAQRAWAQLNPDARFYGKPATMEDYLASPWVIHPYRVMDHCVMSDVGTAFIMTTADRARNLKKKPIYVKGTGFGDAMRKHWWERSLFTQTDAAHAKRIAFEEAGISLADVDVAEMYDCYTGEFIIFCEDYGFCAKGEGGDFVASGATAPGGAHPMNTHGGMLSGVHNRDMPNIIEAVRQLRGEAGERQVAGAEIAIANGHGGEYVLPWMSPIHGVVVLGNTLS
jgi:acetyl-CoA acetyltransferase